MTKIELQLSLFFKQVWATHVNVCFGVRWTCFTKVESFSSKLGDTHDRSTTEVYEGIPARGRKNGKHICAIACYLVDQPLAKREARRDKARLWSAIARTQVSHHRANL